MVSKKKMGENGEIVRFFYGISKKDLWGAYG